MFKDVLIPSKLGRYFIFAKRILSIEITQYAVHGVLVYYKGYKVELKHSMSIVLKDFSSQAIVSAIKKIVNKVGKYDEIVTSLSTSAIVFKELELPFIGRDKIEMVVPYEVEALLPFALDQAVIDFMIVAENYHKQTSTIIVSAALRSDIDTSMALFEKANIQPSIITIDMFALYNSYNQGMYLEKEKRVKLSNVAIKNNEHKEDAGNLVKNLQEKVKESVEQQHIEILIDLGFEVTKILYMSYGLLRNVRTLPIGVADIAQSISTSLELSYYDVVQDLFELQELKYKQEVEKEFFELLSEVSKSIMFFQRDMKDVYQKPERILLSGLGCMSQGFVAYSKTFFDMPVHEVDTIATMKKMGIKIAKNQEVIASQFSTMSVAVYAAQQNDINLLKTYAYHTDMILLYQQVFAIIMLTVVTIGGLFWLSNAEIQKWDRAYIASKKELASTIEQKMRVDLKSEKNLKNIVQKAEETLKKRHKLWFSFSKQTEQSYLEYLQELSIAVDRDSLGLNLKKVRLEPDKVIMAGSVKDFESLEVFEEELMSLQRLSLVDKPRELTFSIELKLKDKDEDQS